MLGVVLFGLGMLVGGAVMGGSCILYIMASAVEGNSPTPSEDWGGVES